MSLKHKLLPLFFVMSFALFAQNTPMSIIDQSLVKTSDIVKIYDPTKQLAKQNSDLELFNYTFAVSIPNTELISKGKWKLSTEGEWIWLLTITAKDAKALSLDFEDLKFDEGDDLFVFNHNEKGYNILNTNIATNKSISEFFVGNNISVEYNPVINDTTSFFTKRITVNYAYKDLLETNSLGFGESGSCQVNASCNKVEDYKPEKRSVVRIMTKKTISGVTRTGWCTGTIIGNTKMDETPYIITADHCFSYFESGQYKPISDKDLDKWRFYFNYESPNCENPSEEGNLADKVMVGANYRANSGTAGDADSDFFLLELKSEIPNSYNPFWAGWDNRNSTSSLGYCYHHPSADIKKISTYTTETVSSQYDKDGPSDTHWKVLWDKGSTEGGSSGSALLNQYGQIIGTLTGGGSSCNNPMAEDYYGKFSYGWQNDKEDIHQLNGWLDPTQSKVKSIVGYDKDGPKDINIVYKDELTIEVNPLIEGVLYFGDIETSDLTEILIYDLKGSLLVEEKSIDSNRMKLYLPSGLYILRTTYKSKVSTSKFLLFN